MTRAGALLKRWREKKGLSQTAAARILDMKQGVLSSYESGEKMPSVVRALEIAKKTRGEVPVETWAQAPRSATG